MSSPAGSSA
jgi:hypothetical protein